MDPVSNPYSPGAGATPPALAGRDAVLADFDIAVRRLALGRHANSVVLTGLRGVGKAVLLREFERIAMAHGWSARTAEAGTDAAFVEDVGQQPESGGRDGGGGDTGRVRRDHLAG